jgi:hypothetical protein
MRGEKGVMPELYARYLQQPGTPWFEAAQALNDASQDLLPQVSSGVLFVAELATLSKNQQKHLAFLAARAEKSNVRLVSFTSEEPKRLVHDQGFDPALMQALAGIVIALPALLWSTRRTSRDRGADARPAGGDAFRPPRIFHRRAERAAVFLGRAISKTSPPPYARCPHQSRGGNRSGDAERVLPQFARRPVDVEVSYDLPLREARGLSGRTSSTTSPRRTGRSRAWRSGAAWSAPTCTASCKRWAFSPSARKTDADLGRPGIRHKMRAFSHGPPI